jgi:lipoprotein-releasing system permease protein
MSNAEAAAARIRATRPFSPFEWILALRYLRPRRKEAFISVIAVFSFLGIMLGVATLVVVMAVMNGFRAELLDKILGINGHIIVQPIEKDLTDYDEVAKRISEVPGVKAAIPIIEGQALASGSTSGGSGVLVRGLRGPDLLSMQKISGSVENAGGLIDFDDSAGVAIGTGLAQSLGVAVGDKILLISPRGAVTPFGTSPRVKPYPVVAIFEIGMSEYDSTYVFMPLSEAQLYFNSPDAAQAIEVYLNDPDQVAAFRPKVEEAAKRPVFTTDWRMRNVTFFNALQVERNVMFTILLLIVLVAALNIISGLIMLVKDKGRDIAILRTMGATRGAILRVFFITGASIGTVGTLVGLGLGAIICANIERLKEFVTWITRTEVFSPELYFLSTLPADMDPRETVAIVVMALALSYLATLYPAWRAARLDPVEALRYE